MPSPGHRLGPPFEGHRHYAEVLKRLQFRQLPAQTDVCSIMGSANIPRAGSGCPPVSAHLTGVLSCYTAFA